MHIFNEIGGPVLEIWLKDEDLKGMGGICIYHKIELTNQPILL